MGHVLGLDYRYRKPTDVKERVLNNWNRHKRPDRENPLNRRSDARSGAARFDFTLLVEFACLVDPKRGVHLRRSWLVSVFDNVRFFPCQNSLSN